MTTTGASPEAAWHAVSDPPASGHSGLQPLMCLETIMFRGDADELTAGAGGSATAGDVPRERGHNAALAQQRS